MRPRSPERDGAGGASGAQARRLVVNPISCSAHGLCAELLPERVILDDWGYPILDGAPVPPELVAHARRAVSACPVLALSLRGTGSGLRLR